METRPIGSLTASIIGLGCNNFGRRLDYEKSAVVIRAALDAGITFFDTADVYGNGQSEEFIGRTLGADRDRVVIATKFGNMMEGQGRGAAPAYIRSAVEASLRRLNTDRIDLYQLHSPDPETPIADTLDALDELVRSGKVLQIGCSNFSAEQLRAAEAHSTGKATAHFASVQNEYSLLIREPEREVLPECARSGIMFLPYFPLASGMLSGKYRKGQPLPEGTRISPTSNYARWLNDRNLTQVEALIAFAEAHGHTILELAFAWLLRWPSVASVIAGATRTEQIKANVAAAGWKLTDSEIAEIETILSGIEANA